MSEEYEEDDRELAEELRKLEERRAEKRKMIDNMKEKLRELEDLIEEEEVVKRKISRVVREIEVSRNDERNARYGDVVKVLVWS